MKGFITLQQLQEAEQEMVRGGQAPEVTFITPFYGSGGHKWPWGKKDKKKKTQQPGEKPSPMD